MDDKIVMQFQLNLPDIDYDLQTITHKISVDSVENIDDAIVSEIRKIAKEKGVTTLMLLDKKRIKEALEKATAKKVKQIPLIRSVALMRDGTMSPELVYSPCCPSCLVKTAMACRYCDQCGQKLDWEDYE